MPKLIPQGTVVVHRDGKSFAVPTNGQAFDFTDQEVDEVTRGNPNKVMFREFKNASEVTLTDIAPIPPTPALTADAEAAAKLAAATDRAVAEEAALKVASTPGKAPSKAELGAKATAKDDGDVL